MFIASRAIEKANILYGKRFTRILNPGGLLCLFGLDGVCDREQIMFSGSWVLNRVYLASRTGFVFGPEAYKRMRIMFEGEWFMCLSTGWPNLTLRGKGVM